MNWNQHLQAANILHYATRHTAILPAGDSVLRLLGEDTAHGCETITHHGPLTSPQQIPRSAVTLVYSNQEHLYPRAIGSIYPYPDLFPLPSILSLLLFPDLSPPSPPLTFLSFCELRVQGDTARKILITSI